jgi:hypothetical protein
MRKIKTYFPLVIIFLSLVLFSPALTNFFSGDDWFHLNISRITNFQQFLNFFSFSLTPQSAAFYRPIPTQVFFFVFHSLFGLNPLPYYLFILGVFGFSLYLVYLLAKKISGSEKLALLTLFFYGFSVTNFTRVYFLSAFQEIAMVVFVLLACLFYLKNESLKNTLYSVLFFVLALGSKETAVVLPLILLLISWWKKRINFWRLLPFGLILGFYLFFRFFHFGGVVGESYLWDFSAKRALNTLSWYTLWSFGAPELLVDYVSSGFRILPRFFTDFPVWSYIILGAGVVTLTSFLLILIQRLRKIDKQSFLAVGWFVLALSPVLFLPWHKFTLELALPLVGFSLFLAQLSLKRSKRTNFFIGSFFLLNLLMNVLTYQTHYSVNRSKIAKKIYNYLNINYPNYPSGQYFEFINDTDTSIETWGSSKQIAHLASESNMLRAIFDNKLLNVYYEDYPGERPPKEKRIPLSSKMFLK